MPRLLKSACFAALALAGCLLLAASPAAAATPNLEVDGNRIRDVKTGNEFIPRGVNWPSFEYACVQGWGYANEGANPDTAQAMLDWNINTVRIPLNQDCWLGDDGLPDNEEYPEPPDLTATGYRDAVGDFVDDLTDAGLVVVLDLHWTGQDGTVADGLRPMADNRSDDFWASAANRFKTNDAVIFDLFNEPHSRWDPVAHDWAFLQSWSCWRGGGCEAPDQADTDLPVTGAKYTTVGMGTLLAAVRGTGASQPVILSGLDYANDLSKWSERAPADDQLIAGFHNYPGQDCDDAACWVGEIETVAAEHPVITAEFGQSDCQADHIERYMKWADVRGIGYLAWAWWVLPEEGCTNYALITDLNGTPTPTYGAHFREHLEDPATPPDDQPPEILPELPRPANRADAGLKIVSAKVRGGQLKARLKVRPIAGKPVSARIEFFRGKKKRKISLKVKIRRGIGTIKRKLPPKAKPHRLVARYPGDKLLLPDKTRFSLKSSRHARPPAP
ncbi:MAG: cellulase family glycosylhydrolase [Thermoleophilia bacterium]|nr:cellulase family glycosylhydrolase [Thermoleophilia bacterium]